MSCSIFFRWWFGLVLVGFFGAVASCPGAPWLLDAQQPTYATRPAYLRDHFAHLETLPFDGLVISSETGRELMAGAALSEAAMVREFAPLQGLVFTRMKHRFALVLVDRPGDFFDDWTVTIGNFRTLARVLRSLGLVGIFLDNEEYLRLLFNHPEDCAHPERPLGAYLAQARLRGRQIMEAMAAEFPELVVLAAHGPYSSFEGTPAEVRAGQTVWELEELRGAFSVGLIEGLDSRGRFVDGGEMYRYRTPAEFEGSFTFRKTTIADAATGCAFIPEYLRGVWSRKVGIGYGIYDRPYLERPMDPPILRATLAAALRQSDAYVWLYTEGQNWHAPGGIGAEWVQAVLEARADVATPGGVDGVGPWVSLVQPADGGVWSRPEAIALEAEALALEGGAVAVEFFDAETSLGQVAAAPYRWTWEHPSPGPHRLRAVATDALGRPRNSGVVEITVTEHFSAAINFQPAGSTPPRGSVPDTGDVFGPRSRGLAYGWNEDHGENMRLRSSGAELRRATLVQIRAGGVWELAVPAGTYRVTVGIGDPGFASVHTVRVEGVSFWTAWPLAAGEVAEQSATVSVTDGRLTLDQGAGGFEETRVAYVLVAAPEAEPAAPGGLDAWIDAPGAVELRWADQSSNESSFELERSTVADFTGPIVRRTLAADAAGYRDTVVLPKARYFYRVRAVGGAGASVFSNVPSVLLPPADTDGDGLDDALEQLPCMGGVDDRVADADGDGFSNAAEWLAQTDAGRGDSFPVLALDVVPADDGALRIGYGFSASPDRSYGVEYCDALAAGVWTLCEGLPIRGGSGWYLGEEVTRSRSRIYRLRVYP